MSHWRTGILGPSTLLSVLLVLVATSAPSAFAQAFERDIAPFPVYDTAGTPLAEPFVGGFARPRPNLQPPMLNMHRRKRQQTIFEKSKSRRRKISARSQPTW